MNILSASKTENKVTQTENYHRRISFIKKNEYHSMKHEQKKDFLLLATKLIKKMLDVNSAKENSKLFLKNENKNWLRNKHY